MAWETAPAPGHLQWRGVAELAELRSAEYLGHLAQVLAAVGLKGLDGRNVGVVQEAGHLSRGSGQ